jgi:hypothetical protein
MKLLLLNTREGLKPCYDEDYEEKKKLKIGEIYEAEIRLPRNLKFLRKYFALLRCSWEYLNEKQQEFFKNNLEVYRKSLEVTAGWCEPIYDFEQETWIYAPKSISFRSMKEEEFNQLYNNVRDILFNSLIPNISQEEFERNLVNFL